MPIRILLTLAATSMLGCGSSGTIVSGTVRVNNRPLAQGHVTFFPVESTKTVRGAPVTDGQFAMKDITPGKWKVLVSTAPEVQSATSASGVPTLIIAPKSVAISPATTGNQTIIEIRAGRQSLDFALKTP